MRKTAVWLLALSSIVHLGFLASRSDSEPTQASPGHVPPAPYWPTDGWRENSPESQGVDSAKLAEMLDFVRAQQFHIHSLLVVRNGYIILDAIFFPYDGSVPHDIASCTKSVTATLVGAAVGQGKIKSVDDRVLAYFPDRKVLNDNRRKQRLTIKDLLTMRSGLDCEYRGGEPTLREMWKSPDWTQFMLDRRMAAEPGREFVYCSGGMHLLSSLLARATGQKVEDFARATLFEPLGIKGWIWPADPQGVNHGWGDLHLAPRDMAKLGFLYLHDGTWEGRRILPADFLAAAVSQQTRTGQQAEYGYGWWVFGADRKGEFEAVGRGGQRISVVPRANAIVVFTGGGFEPGPIGNLLTQAFVSDDAIPENTAAQARLALALLEAHRGPPAASPAPLPDLAHEVSGRTYEVDANPFDLETIRLKFEKPDEATVYLTFLDGHAEARPIGLDGKARVSAGGQHGLPVGLRGKWISPDTFELEYDEIANINCPRLQIKFEGESLRIEMSNRTSATAPVRVSGKQVHPEVR